MAHVWPLCVLLTMACASQTAEPVTSAEGLRCALADPDGQHLSQGAEVELLKGYQGYLLVQATAHVWGNTPRQVSMRVSGAQDGGAPLLTVVGARPLHTTGDGHWASEPLEVWLSPPNPSDFAGKKGEIVLEVRSAGASCEQRLRVTYVDKTFCVHHDDGTVVCPED